MGVVMAKDFEQKYVRKVAGIIGIIVFSLGFLGIIYNLQ
jgi:hypothetical protein